MYKKGVITIVNVAEPIIMVDSSGSMPTYPYPKVKPYDFSYDEHIVSSKNSSRCVIHTDSYNVHVLRKKANDLSVHVVGKESLYNAGGVVIEKNDTDDEFSVSVNRKIVGSSNGIEIFVYIQTTYSGDLIIENKYGNTDVDGTDLKFKGVNINACSGDISWGGDINIGGFQASSKFGNVSIYGKLFSDIDFSSNSMRGDININVSNCKDVTGMTKTYMPVKDKIKVGDTDCGEYVFSASILTTCGTISINDKKGVI